MKIRGNTQIIAGTITDAEIASAAGIALSKLAEAVIQADGGQAFTGDQSMGSHKLTNVTDPASAQDAATKGYVDQVAAGMNFKDAVRVATTANITLSGAQTIDGVSVIAGDRVLVKDQSTGANNGIYVCAAGAWSRSTDADVSAEVKAGLLVYVNEGTANGDKSFVLTTNNPITLGSTALVFVQFGAGGSPHNLLSATHSDTTAASPSKGDLITSDGSTWKRKAVSGTDMSVLVEDSTQTDGLAWMTMGVPGAFAYRATAQTLTNVTEAAISFSNTLFDTDTFWAGGSPTRLTVPANKGGLYKVVAQVALTILGGTGSLYVRLYKNGTKIAEAAHNVTGLTPFAQVSTLVSMAATDYIEVKAYLDESGGTTHDTVGGSAATFLAMVKAGSSAGSGGGGASGNVTSTAVHTSRPGSGTTGDLFLPSDGITIDRWSGSVWAPWGPIHPLTEPLDTGFSWVNQGSSVLTAAKNVLSLAGAATGAGANIVARVKTAPGTPYTITAAMLGCMIEKQWQSFGLVFRESSSGKVHVFDLLANGTLTAIRSAKFTSATVFSAQYIDAAIATGGGLLWLRITDNGTNRICSVSRDGLNFIQIHSVSRTDFLTADQVGFMVGTENAGTPNYAPVLSVLSWKQT